MYRFVLLVFAFAGAGLVLRFVSMRKKSPSILHLALLAAIYFSFWAALAYHAAGAFEVTGYPLTLGHYLCCIAVVEAVLLAAGLEAISPGRTASGAVPFLTICFAALELFGMNFYSIPYYSGITRSTANGEIPALNLRHLLHGGLSQVFAGLALNKPAFLGPRVLAILWLLFEFATLAVVAISLVAISLRASRRGAILSTAPPTPPS